MIRSWTTIATKALTRRRTKRSAARWQVARSSTSRRRQPALQVPRRPIRRPRQARRRKNRVVQRPEQRKKLGVGRLPGPGVPQKPRDLAERLRLVVVRRRANRHRKGVRQRRAHQHGDRRVEKPQKDAEAGRSADAFFSGIQPKGPAHRSPALLRSTRGGSVGRVDACR